MLDVVSRHRLWAAAVALLLPVSASAGTISLAWNRVAGAAGYQVFYGTSSGQYTGSVDAGNVCQSGGSGSDSCGTIVADLSDCTTWYLAVKAYDSNHQLSPQFSNEITGWPAPRVDSLNTTSAQQGAQLTVELDGANFQAGSSVLFVPPSGETVACGSAAGVPNPGLKSIEATSVAPVQGSCNRLQALISVTGSVTGELAAEVGTWDVEVLGPADGFGKHVFGARQDAFEVTISPIRYDVNTSDTFDDVKRLTTADTQWLLGSNASFLVNPNSCGRDPRYLEALDLDGNGMIDGDDIAFIYSSGVTDLLETCWSGTGWSTGACPVR
jgi:hypothetical protein